MILAENPMVADCLVMREHWMRCALDLAKDAVLADEVPVGAIVVLGGKVIGQGFNNSVRNHDPSGHAEIVALRNAARNLGNHRLVGARMYVTIEPCVMCAGAIVQARLSQLVYGATDPKAGAAGSVLNVLQHGQLNHRCEVVGGVLELECGALMKNYFELKRQIQR